MHTYYVNAVDNAGNESGWQTFTVKVDTQSPVFSGNLTVKNPTKEGADIAFTPSEGGKVYWIVSDTGTAPTAQEVKEQSGHKGGVQDVVGGTANSFTITGLSAGEKHTVYVVLEDGVGNLSEVKTESFLTLQKAPEITLEQLIIDYTNETITVPDSIGDVEVYTDLQHPESSRITPDAAGVLPVTPGTVIYIRYPEKTEGSLTTPASDKAEIQIPDRPDKPAEKQVTVTDTTAKVTNPDSGEEYVFVKKGDNPDWSNANATGQFTGLDPNTEYDIYVRIKATNGSFTSEPAKIPVRTYVRIKEPVIEGEGTGKDGNTASRTDAPDAAGMTVTFAGTYGEEYTPVIKEVDGMEYTPEMTWDEGSRIGRWKYTLNVPDHVAEVGITVRFRKRTLTGITTEPGSLTIYADDAANKSIDGLTAYLKNNCSVKAEYDNQTKGTLQADYTTTDSFVPKGRTYRYTVFADGKTKDITLTVAPVTAVAAAPAKLMQIQNADGYTTAEVNAWLPAQVTVTYTGADYTTRTENRTVTWNTAFIGSDFGAATGERTITGTVDLPPWATGQNSVSIVVEFADKVEVEDDDEDDGDDNSTNTTGDNKVIIDTSTGKPSVTLPVDIDKPASGTEGSSDKTSDTQERETQEDTTILKPKDGAVIVTVICEDEKNTASVRDTEAVVNAVLTPEQIKLVNDGKTIEIRVDVKDISKTVSEQDKKVIESGFAEYQKEMPGLTLGMYVDISMFIRVGEGDWDAVTHTKEPIEVVIGIPEELKGDDRKFSIIRSHDGEYTLLPDMDNDSDTITVSTDMFSAYAIAYEQADKGKLSASGESSAKCGLCHICPTFLGICLFIWLAVILALLLIIWIVIWSKRMKNQLWE